jgi:hypothetical protein
VPGALFDVFDMGEGFGSDHDVGWEMKWIAGVFAGWKNVNRAMRGMEAQE